MPITALCGLLYLNALHAFEFASASALTTLRALEPRLHSQYNAKTSFAFCSFARAFTFPFSPFSSLLLEPCNHLQGRNGAFITFVAKAAAAALLCLEEIVGGYETENDRCVKLYIQS